MPTRGELWSMLREELANLRDDMRRAGEAVSYTEECHHLDQLARKLADGLLKRMTKTPEAR